MRKLLDSIRWKLLAGRFGRLVRDATQLPYVYDGARGGHERIFLGQGVKLSNATMNVVSGEIHIGDHTFFGGDVSLLTGAHDMTVPRADRPGTSPRSGRDIHIGSGVWIASNVTVIGPCRIGDDVVVAAGAVVTPGEIPSGVMVGGVPAKIIARRGDDHA